MNAVMRAKQIYEERKFKRALDKDLSYYLKSDTGVVIATPDWFGMAHPVHIENKHKPLEEWWNIKRYKDQNAWFVLFALGPLYKLVKQFPYPLEYVCYHRNGIEWHCVEFKKLERLSYVHVR